MCRERSTFPGCIVHCIYRSGVCLRACVRSGSREVVQRPLPVRPRSLLLGHYFSCAPSRSICWGQENIDSKHHAKTAYHNAPTMNVVSVLRWCGLFCSVASAGISVHIVRASYSLCRLDKDFPSEHDNAPGLRRRLRFWR